MRGDSPGFNAKKLFLQMPLVARIRVRTAEGRKAELKRLAADIESYATSSKTIERPDKVVALPKKLSRKIKKLTEGEKEQLGHSVEVVETRIFGRWQKFFVEKNPGSDIHIDENGHFDFYKSTFVFNREHLKLTEGSVCNLRDSLWKLKAVRKALSEEKALEAVQRHGRLGLMQYVGMRSAVLRLCPEDA